MGGCKSHIGIRYYYVFTFKGHQHLLMFKRKDTFNPDLNEDDLLPLLVVRMTNINLLAFIKKKYKVSMEKLLTIYSIVQHSFSLTGTK